MYSIVRGIFDLGLSIDDALICRRIRGVFRFSFFHAVFEAFDSTPEISSKISQLFSTKYQHYDHQWNSTCLALMVDHSG